MGWSVSGAQSVSLFESLRTRYLSGEDDVFASAFPDYESFRRARGSLLDEINRRHPVWEPSRVVVALELGQWIVEHKWPDGPAFIDAARNQLVRRPTRPGADEGLDIFELVVHHAAITALVTSNHLAAARDYVLQTDGRIATPTIVRDRIDDPRWELTKAWIYEYQTAPLAFDDGSEAMPSLAVRTVTATNALRAAAAGYSRAMDARDVSAEAAVRFAFAQHRMGDHRSAAAALARVTASEFAGDLVLQYWRAIVAGRVHEALDDAEQADRDYRQAVALWGGAQTPLVALASLLERRGRSIEAEEWAERVRTLPAKVSDPWWLYWTGDLRFLPDWRKALRQVRP